MTTRAEPVNNISFNCRVNYYKIKLVTIIFLEESSYTVSRVALFAEYWIYYRKINQFHYERKKIKWYSTLIRFLVLDKIHSK